MVKEEREIREVLRRYLERAGYAAHTTASGCRGDLASGLRGVDLVVLDLGLPDVEGLEVLAAVRDRAARR